MALEAANVNGGYFEFRLCANNDFKKVVTKECLDKGLLEFEDGSTRYSVIKEGLNKVRVKLPKDIQCDQCVLQWRYNTGKYISKHYKCISLACRPFQTMFTLSW